MTGPAAPPPDVSLATRFTALAGVRLPIVQTGMGWVAGPRLAAATSAAGGLGILAGATMTAEQARRCLRRTRELTSAPFGLNLRADQVDLAERVEDAIAHGVTLISFAGPPGRDTVARLHDAGMLVMPTIGAPRHAEKVAALGVDAVIAQGGEGGGHTGSVPTSLLVPAVVDAVGGTIPVVAAGGFHDGRGLAAALALGADGVAMGTRFLVTVESRADRAALERYVAAELDGTVVTTAIDGAPQRVLATPLVARITRRGRLAAVVRAVAATRMFVDTTGGRWRDLVKEGWAMRRHQQRRWTEVALAASAPMLTRAGVIDGDVDGGILPAGQVAGMLHDVPTVAELIGRIDAEARTALAALTARVAAP
jgi:NAD(P)H-dependent flavin oxidoreductase YrpB (nitropropane dioxygenase family)